LQELKVKIIKRKISKKEAKEEYLRKIKYPHTLTKCKTEYVSNRKTEKRPRESSEAELTHFAHLQTLRLTNANINYPQKVTCVQSVTEQSQKVGNTFEQKKRKF